MKGEEVTDRFGDKPIHINGLDPARVHQADRRQLGRRHGAEDGRRDSRRGRRAEHQPSELRLGDLRRRARGRCSARDCSRSSTAIRPSTTSAAAACPVSKKCGIACCRAARCSTASPWTMRITSSGRRTRRAPRPGQGWVYVRVAAARIARARRGARARRLLFVDRRRAAVDRRDRDRV